jgi:hypothetical protein
VAGSELRLVALLSDPKSADYPALDLENEAKQIREALTDASVVKPEFHTHATLDMLQDALVKPAHIFHFAGHGDFEAEMGEKLGEIEGRGFLVLVGDDGGAFHFGAEKLAQTLNRRGVRLAVLGACQGGRRDGLNPWTGVAPALTRAGIPAVVAMQLSIRDKNAVAFSRRFYRALANGEPIDFAVTDGRIAIFNRATEDDERDWGVPVLYMRADQGTLFPAAPDRAPTRSANDAPRATPSPGPSPASSDPAQPIDKIRLREAIIRQFSEEDLALLCDDLTSAIGQDISLEVVGGASKPAKVLNLIQYMDRRSWLPALVKAVRSARPGSI